MKTGRILFCILMVFEAGCFFQPNLEPYGYTDCQTDSDCTAGRYCNLELCTPPVWYDDNFLVRQLLLVENASTEPLPAQTAVPVRIGEGGLISVEDLGPDGRFLLYDHDAYDSENPSAAWEEAPVFRDLYSDFLVAWIPTQQELQPGDNATLSWLYTEHESSESIFVDQPEEVFTFYDDFMTLSGPTSDGGIDDSSGLDDTLYSVTGPGTPNLSEGKLTILSDQKFVLTKALSPPVRVVLYARLNGLSCSGVFLGLMGDTGPGDRLPYLGFRVGAGVNLVADLAPTATGNPASYALTNPIDAPTALHRYSFEIDSGAIRLGADEEETYARDDLVPPFSDEPLYLTVDVYGGCSVDIEGIYTSHTRFKSPIVTVETAVDSPNPPPENSNAE